MTRFISVNLFFVTLLVLSACNLVPTSVPSTSSPFLSEHATKPSPILPTSIPILPPPIVAEAVFDMYIGAVDITSLTHQMMGMSRSCLLAYDSCKISTISGFPDTNTSVLSWDPQGTQAWFHDHFSGALLSFKPQDQNMDFETITELPLVNFPVAWSPDGKWGTVSVEDSPYASHIMLVDSNTHETLDLTQTPIGIQYPIGWPSDQEIIVFVEKYQPIEGDIEKQDIESCSIYSINIHNKQVTTLFEDILDMQPSLSPDGNYLLFSTPLQDSVSWQLVNMANNNVSVVNIRGGFPVWAPNEKWIATIEGGLSGSKVFVYQIDTQQTYKVFESDSYTEILAWLPDSEYLLVKTRIVDQITGNDKTPLYLLQIPNGHVSEVAVPDFDFGVYNIEWLSWRPTQKP